MNKDSEDYEMKKIKYLTAILVIVSLLLMTSCNYFYSGRFDGGELLDDELIESIRTELFSTDKTYYDKIENSVAETESSESETSANIDETNLTENYNSSDTEENSEAAESTYDNSTVYWTEKGSVWHLYKDCGYLSKSKEIKSGSVENAVEAGKDKLCSSCGKKKN